MNVRKFIAENSRLAMRQVKLELGDDAVILSSRQVAGGLEIMAAPMSDMAALVPGAARAARPAPAQAQAEAPAPAASPANTSEPQSFVDFARQFKGGAKNAMQSHVQSTYMPAEDDAPGPQRVEPKVAARVASSSAAAVEIPKTAKPALQPKREPQITEPSFARADQAPSAESQAALMAELKSMRSLMEAQLANLAWSDSARRSPVKTKLASQMLAAGFSPSLARAVAARLPDDFSAVQAEQWLSTVIEANVRKASLDEMINKGGVYALVGPTGVGKTTTTAKLAARYVMTHGAQKLGLISADSYRIGAQDQLRIYGRILGVPVHAVQDAGELHATLAGMRDKHLVLIDTIGVGQRDERVAEQIALLGAPGIKRLLLLNAACQGETLEDVVRAYKGGDEGESKLWGCCISKLDESVKPGAALDAAIRHKLPLHYVTTGQRVPEDLHLPNVPFLVHRALKAAASDAFRMTADEAGLLLAPAGMTQ